MKLVDKARSEDQNSSSFFSNPNVQWLQSKGCWMIHIYLIIFFKLLFSIIPGISAEASWTMTNLFYNMASFIIFHWLVGTPFEDIVQDEQQSKYLTLWEQIDRGEQYTPTKKFLTTLPIVLFLLSVHYSNYDLVTFSVNFLSVSVNLIGKMPFMDKVRLFGINKRD
jgi:hypothetical protein